MVKISSIFVLGLIVTFMPFSGFPIEWEERIYIICGLLIAGLSLLIRKELHEVLRAMHRGDIKNDTFSESSPVSKDDNQ